jgi:hypothetical protein
MQANGKSIRVRFAEVLRDVKGRWVVPVAETAQAPGEDRGDEANAVFGGEGSAESGIIKRKRRRLHGVLPSRRNPATSAWRPVAVSRARV